MSSDGTDDLVIGRAIQEEMGRLIPDSRALLYSGYGHGNDQENPAYEREVALRPRGLRGASPG